MRVVASLVLMLSLAAGLAVRVDAADRQLVWSDEFNYQGAPDRTKWNYEEGFVRNREMQYYTRDRRENARVENGMLVIEARRERMGNPRYKAGSPNWKESRQGAGYTSASLTTMKRQDFLYGRIEVRAKLPHGGGMWPAIWTLGSDMPQVGYPGCGEIDLMEFFGSKPDKVYANVHYGERGRNMSRQGRVGIPYDDAFHVFALEWRPDRLDFFLDGVKYHSFLTDAAGKGASNPFRKPHYLILNLALGGSSGGAIDDAELPQKFLVDYVRVYRLADEGAGARGIDSK